MVGTAPIITTGVTRGTTPSSGPRFSLAQRGVIGVFLAVFVLLGWRIRPPLALAAGDELVYLALSRSIEGGSYRELYRPSAPWHVQYPPGYPAWLVIVRHLTGEHIEAMRVFNFALVAAALLVLLLTVRPLLKDWQSMALLGILAINPGLLLSGGLLYSEALYLFLSTGALASALMSERSTGKRASRWAYAAVALALTAFMTRSVGLALVGAIGVWLLSRRRREVVAYAIASSIIVGGWFGYVALAPHHVAVARYSTDFTSDRAAQRPPAPASIVARVSMNALNYGTQTLPYQLAEPTIPRTSIDNVIWLCINVLTLVVGIAWLWSRWRALAVYLALYAGTLLLWTWPVNRFLWPIIPYTLLAIVLGFHRVTSRLSSRASFTSMVVLLSLLALGAALSDARSLEATATCDPAKPYESSGCYAPDVRSIVLASRYIQQRAAPNDFVLAQRAPAVAFLSGHRAESAQLAVQVDAEHLVDTLRAQRIRFVLLTTSTAFERTTLARVLLASCHGLRTEARFPAGTILLRTAAPNDTTTDACDDLREFTQVATKPSGPRT